jgi:hypothetical protein
LRARESGGRRGILPGSTVVSGGLLRQPWGLVKGIEIELPNDRTLEEGLVTISLRVDWTIFAGWPSVRLLSG